MEKKGDEMSTRATIKFTDGDETFFVYRGHDGFPENILPDISAAIQKSRGRWSEPMCCMLVTFFLGMHFDIEKRLPNYEITSDWHGDESYRYSVSWVESEKKWLIEQEEDVF